MDSRIRQSDTIVKSSNETNQEDPFPPSRMRREVDPIIGGLQHGEIKRTKKNDVCKANI